MKINLQKIREDLHKIPEIGFKEFKTQKYIINYLNTLKLNTKKIAETGVLAFVDLGFDKTICFRADIDGLKIEEKNDVGYKSIHKGYMHACGHDGHTATLLGFASYIASNDLSNVKYNILLIFQPAEEGPGGASLILKENIIKNYNVDKIFGMHLMPYYKEGLILSKEESLMSSATEFDLEFIGKSAHIAKPSDGIDALDIALRFILDIKNILKEDIKNKYIFGVGKFESGTARNIVSNKTVINGTYRTLSKEDQKDIYDLLTKLINQYEEKYSIKIKFSNRNLYPVVFNDKDLYYLFKEITEKEFMYKELEEPLMLAEDFSYYQKEVKGIFFFLGTLNKRKGYTYPLHSDKFNFDAEVLNKGLLMYINILNNIGGY